MNGSWIPVPWYWCRLVHRCSGQVSHRRETWWTWGDEHEEMATFAEIATGIVFEKRDSFGYDLHDEGEEVPNESWIPFTLNCINYVHAQFQSLQTKIFLLNLSLFCQHQQFNQFNVSYTEFGTSRYYSCWSVIPWWILVSKFRDVLLYCRPYHRIVIITYIPYLNEVS